MNYKLLAKLVMDSESGSARSIYSVCNHAVRAIYIGVGGAVSPMGDCKGS